MRRLGIVFLMAYLGFSQNTGRFTELTAKGISLLEHGHYNEAVNALEEIWEQDRTDTVVAENLAMGYLYADHDVERAKKLDQYAIDNGGRASFLIQHPHEKIALLSGEMAEYCNGRFSIYKDRLAFVSSDERHSFTIEGANFKEIKTNRIYGSDRGMYHIRTSDKKNYNFRPRTWSEQETQLILFLIGKYIKK